MTIETAETVQLVRLGQLGYELKIDTATLAMLRFGVAPAALTMGQCSLLILELEREAQRR
jgi:hypothetical protein